MELSAHFLFVVMLESMRTLKSHAKCMQRRLVVIKFIFKYQFDKRFHKQIIEKWFSSGASILFDSMRAIEINERNAVPAIIPQFYFSTIN